jgi:hypothetical protein
VNTIGTVRVASSNGPSVEPPAKMTSGASATNSVAYFRVVPTLPALARISIRTLQERANASFGVQLFSSRTREDTDAPHPLRLLRAYCERPCSRSAAKKRDELASLHAPAAVCRG